MSTTTTYSAVWSVVSASNANTPFQGRWNDDTPVDRHPVDSKPPRAVAMLSMNRHSAAFAEQVTAGAESW